MYTNFAKVYDELMKDVDYRSWANYYISIMNSINPNAKNILECACGTANLSCYFANKYNLTACDLSGDMLNIAKLKARQMQLYIKFIHSDMCDVKLNNRQDFVLATCDGVNYLLTKEKALSFFINANRNLNLGGALIFDISSQYKLYQLLPSQPWVNFDEDLCYMWQNFVEKNKTHMDLSIFVKKSNMYYRIDETQVQTCFSIETYKRLLKYAGFTNIKIYGDKTFRLPRTKEERWHFVAIKEKEYNN